MRAFSIYSKAIKETEWQLLPVDADYFEASVRKVCDLIKRGDPRIGRIPASRPKTSKTIFANVGILFQPLKAAVWSLTNGKNLYSNVLLLCPKLGSKYTVKNDDLSLLSPTFKYMLEENTGWLKRQSPLKQIALMFSLNFIIFFPLLWLAEELILERNQSLGYYILEAFIMSVLFTLVFGWNTIKSIKQKREQK